MDTSPAMETKASIFSLSHCTITRHWPIQLAERVRRAIEEEYHDRMLPETHPTTRYVKRVVSQLLEANDLGTLQSDNTEFTHVPGDESWDPDSWRLKGTKTETEPKREWTVFVVDADETVNAAANMCKSGLQPFLPSLTRHSYDSCVHGHSSYCMQRRRRETGGSTIAWSVLLTLGAG
jgi:hypothetical protein